MSEGIRDRIKRLDRVRAGDLKADERNWRRHPERQKAAVAAALKEVGYADALIARETEDGLVLVDGHLRADLDDEQVVPVLVLDVDEREAAKLLATLDPLAALAVTDRSALTALTEDLDLGEELSNVVADLTASTKGLHDGEVPEPPSEEDAVTKRGDCWTVGKHRLVCGDSTDAEVVARACDGRKVDLVITDPPYGVDYTGGAKARVRIDNDAKPDELADFLRTVFSNVIACTRSGAPWYVCAPTGPASKHFSIVLDDLNVWKQTLVWVKDRATFGRSDYRYQHEGIYYGWTPGAQRTTQRNRKATSVLLFDRPVKSDAHPTMKPVALFGSLITNSTDRGNVVLDPFLGSGTSIIAAEQAGRYCYGVEQSPAYCDGIVQRWEELTGGKAVRNG